MTQTTRLFARCAGRVEPEWIEAVAGDRVTREHFDARWDKARGEVVASERVQLYGLTLVARRPVVYGAMSPKDAREVFIREALVADALGVEAPFAAHNRALVAQIEQLEHKARRQDVLVDDETIAAFYAERIPADVHSRAAFERWRRHEERRDPGLLFMTREAADASCGPVGHRGAISRNAAVAGATLPLKYRFAPGHPLDGLTLTVPLALLNQVDDATLSWLVPGMIRDKVTRTSRRCQGVAQSARSAAGGGDGVPRAGGPSRRRACRCARRWLRERLGEAPPAQVLRDIELPAHLNDERPRRRRARARARHGSRPRRAARAARGGGPAGIRRGAAHHSSGAVFGNGTFGELPETLTMRRDGQQRTGYPALVDEPDGVALTLLDTRDAALAATRKGIVRLIGYEQGVALARMVKAAPAAATLALQFRGAIAADSLQDDLCRAVADRAYIGDDPLPRDRDAFAAQVRRARTRTPAVVESALRLAGAIASEYHALSQRLRGCRRRSGCWPPKSRLNATRWSIPDSCRRHPGTPLTQVPRYLQALARRIERYPQNPSATRRHAAQVAEWWGRYCERADAERRSGGNAGALEAFRWMIEELRVSLFAQELRTPAPVSLKRVEKAWHELSRRG